MAQRLTGGVRVSPPRCGGGGGGGGGGSGGGGGGGGVVGGGGGGSGTGRGDLSDAGKFASLSAAAASDDGEGAYYLSVDDDLVYPRDYVRRYNLLISFALIFILFVLFVSVYPLNFDDDFVYPHDYVRDIYIAFALITCDIRCCV